MPAPRINMRKLKDALRLTFEGQQSHQQIATALGITAGKDSLPGKLLQGKSQVFVFVGAACWRMVAVNVHHRRQRFACRQAPTREKPGLCLCRSQPAGEWWRSTSITAGKDSLAGKLLQGKSQVLSL